MTDLAILRLRGTGYSAGQLNIILTFYRYSRFDFKKSQNDEAKSEKKIRQY